MAGPPINAVAVPTGGVINLSLWADGKQNVGVPGASGNLQLSRSLYVSGSTPTWTEIYNGPPITTFIDFGDSSPGPLQAAQYIYQGIDNTGTTTTAPVLAGCTIAIVPDGMTNILIRLIQAGLTNISFPTVVKRPVVTTAMPTQGFPALPLCVVNLDLIQQKDIPIGQDSMMLDLGSTISNQTTTIPGHAKRVWKVSVLSANPFERDCLRDAILAIFHASLLSVFSAIGGNISHDFQASSGQTVNEFEGKLPGFYYADIMLMFDGVFNTIITTNYGLIETIDFTGYTPDGVAAVVTTVPQP